MSEVRCPCGAWVWEPPGAEVPGWGTAGGPTRERRAYCWGCRSELGERDGTPVVTPMVPRAALAGVLEHARGDPWHCPPWLASEGDQCDGDCRYTDHEIEACWERFKLAALAAGGEGGG